MKPFHFDPEQHTTAIDNATIKAAARLHNEYMDGKAGTVNLILDAVDAALQDRQALHDLVRNTIAGMSSMGRLVTDVIQAEAEQIAIAEVEQQVRQQYEAYVEQRYDAVLEHAA